MGQREYIFTPQYLELFIKIVNGTYIYLYYCKIHKLIQKGMQILRYDFSTFKWN